MYAEFLPKKKINLNSHIFSVLLLFFSCKPCWIKIRIQSCSIGQAVHLVLAKYALAKGTKKSASLFQQGREKK